MRRLLPGVVLGLGLALAVLGLALDRLIDETLLRARIAEWSARTTGAPLVVERASTRIFPRPVVTLGQARIEGSPAIDLAVDRIDLELDIWALLRGDTVIRRALLVRPQAIVSGDPVALLEGLDEAALPGVSVDMIEIADGSVALGDAFRAHAFDGRAALASLRGPITLDGEATLSGERLAFSFETGAIDERGAAASRLDMRLIDDGGALSARGVLRLAGGAREFAGAVEGASDDPARLIAWAARLFAAPATAAPAIGADRDPKAPFGFAARLTLGGAMAFEELALRVGASLWRGEASVERDAGRPRFDLALAARTVDLADLGAGARLAAAARAAFAGDARGRLRLDARRINRAGAGFAADLATDLALAASLDGATLVIERLDATPIGGGALQFAGLADLQQGALRGDLTARADDLGLAAGAIAERLLQPLAGVTVELASGLRVEERRVAADGVALALGLDEFAGDVVLTLDDQPRLSAKGAVARLDLDAWEDRLIPLLDGWRGSDWRGFEPVAASPTIALALDLAIERLAWREERARDVRLIARADRAGVVVERLRSEDFLGGVLDLEAAFAAEGRRVDLALDLEAARPGGVAQLLGLPPPRGALARALSGSTLRLEGLRRADDASLSLTFAAAGARGEIEARIEGAPDDPAFAVETVLAFDQGLFLLEGREIADPTLRLDAGAPVRSALALTRRQGDAARGELTIDALGGRARLVGALRSEVGASMLVGDLALDDLDVARAETLWRAAARAAPVAALPPWPGDLVGRLPRAPLAPEGFGALGLDLALSIGADARDARGGGRLALDRDRLFLELEQAPLAGGALDFRATVEPQPGVGARPASLGARGRFALREVDASALSRSWRGFGALSAEVEWAAAGSGARGLARGLSGVGDLRLEAPALGDALLRGGFRIERGHLRSEEAGFALQSSEGPARVDVAVDLVDWIAALRQVGRDGVARHWLGPPDRLRPLARAPAGVAPSGPNDAPALLAP